MKQKKKPEQLREAEKAHDASIYGDGYRHGYKMGRESFITLWKRYQAQGLSADDTLKKIQDS